MTDLNEPGGFAYPRALLDRLAHPYLFFAADDVPALRAKVKKPAFAPSLAVLVRQAEHDLTFPTAGQPRPRSGGGQPPDGPRGFQAIVCRAAFMHLLTGEQRYLDRCMKEIEAVARTRWLTSGYTRDDPANAIWFGDLGLGERALAIALAYDWLYDSLSGSQRALILEIAREKVFEPHWMAAQRRGEWGTREYMNWNPVINGGVGVLALATLADLPEAHRALEVVRWLLPRFIDRIGADGDWDEGLMYTQYAIRYGASFILALRHALGSDDGLGERFRNVGYFTQMLRWRDRDGQVRQFRFRDSSPLAGRMPVYLLGLFPENRDYLRLFDAEPAAAELFGPEKCSARWHDYSFWTHDDLIFRPDAPIDQAPVPLPRAKHFADSGIFCRRGERLHFCALGIQTGANHGQMDMGSFELVYDRELLITDLNYGDRDSLVHSCLAVNGGGQEFRMAGRMHGLVTSEDEALCAISLELPSLYGPVLRRYHRHFLIVREVAVVIVDEVEALEPVRLEARFTALHPVQTVESCEACARPCACIRGDLYGLRIVSHPAAGRATFRVRDVTSLRDLGESYRQAISELDRPVTECLWLHVMVPYPLESGAGGQMPAVKIEFPDEEAPLSFALDYGDGRRDLVTATRTPEHTLDWSLREE